MPYVSLEDIDIHYLEAGLGKKLVLLHGLGNNARSWSNQLDGLSSDYHVISWDAPGYGKSSDPNPEFRYIEEFSNVLHDVLEKITSEPIYLVGSSMGAAIAIDFASRFPKKVERLVLADVARGAGSLSEEENKKRLEQRLYAIDNFSPEELAKKRVRELLSVHADESVIQFSESIVSQVRGPGYRSGAYSIYHLNQSEHYNKLTMPTLLIWGELDQVSPIEFSKVLQKQIPNCVMKSIPKTGHLPYMEDPSTFNQLVRDFLSIK